MDLSVATSYTPALEADVEPGLAKELTAHTEPVLTCTGVDSKVDFTEFEVLEQLVPERQILDELRSVVVLWTYIDQIEELVERFLTVFCVVSRGRF